jgi:hypothetical protein
MVSLTTCDISSYNIQIIILYVSDYQLEYYDYSLTYYDQLITIITYFNIVWPSQQYILEYYQTVW